jgi:hypothetical protein
LIHGPFSFWRRLTPVGHAPRYASLSRPFRRFLIHLNCPAPAGALHKQKRRRGFLHGGVSVEGHE